jgi:Secretion system C-terminal sorting domain
MKNILFIIHLLYASITYSQPSGYIPGTQVCWNFNGRDHGYFRSASTTGEKHILITFTGDGEINCSNYQNQAPQKWLNDSGRDWDGNTTKTNGTIVNWEIFTLPKNADYNIPIYATDIDYFFNAIGLTNTNQSNNIHIQGLSGGVGRMWGYMTNQNNHNSVYRNVFSTTISMSGVNLGNTNNVITNYSIGRRHWVWHGLADANGGTPVVASQTLHDNYLCATCDKQLTLQPGGTHSSNTWDVTLALPIAGDTRQNNRWLWMVEPATLDLANFENTLQVNLYPNPTNGLFTIETNNSNTIQIDLVNKLGQIVKTQNLDPQNNVIDAQNLSTGIYIVKITDKNKTSIKRLIITN